MEECSKTIQTHLNLYQTLTRLISGGLSLLLAIPLLLLISRDKCKPPSCI